MNSLRKVGGLLVVLMLVGFALPGSAQNNIKRSYSLDAATSAGARSLDAGVSTPFKVTVSNTSPDGISAFKAFSLTAPAGITITPGSATLSSSSPLTYFPTPAPVSNSGRTVTFENISPPVKSINDTSSVGVWQVTVSMTVTVTCPTTFTRGDWDANVRTGSLMTGGQPFTQVQRTTLQGTPLDIRYTELGAPCPVPPVNLTWNIGAGGSADPASTTNCPAQVPSGSNASCTVKENSAAYAFSGFSGCDPDSNSGASYSGKTCNLTTVTGPKTVTANFTPLFHVTWVSSPSGSRGACAPEYVASGGSSTCAASTIAGMVFQSWSNCSPVSGNPASCTVSSVTADTVATANYIPQTGQVGCTTNSLLSSGTTGYDPNNDGFVGTPGWGLRRGANTDASNCNDPLVNVSVTQVGNTWKVTADKTSITTATFYYVFVGEKVKVDANGYSVKRPWLSWGVDTPSASLTWPDWVPALMCNADPADISTMTPAQLAALLPTIPNEDPFNNTSNYPQSNSDPSKNRPQYKPGVTAKACVSEQGSTSIIYELLDPTQPYDATTNPYVTKVQYHHKVVDEVDLSFGYE